MWGAWAGLGSFPGTTEKGLQEKETDSETPSATEGERLREELKGRGYGREDPERQTDKEKLRAGVGAGPEKGAMGRGAELGVAEKEEIFPKWTESGGGMRRALEPWGKTLLPANTPLQLVPTPPVHAISGEEALTSSLCLCLQLCYLCGSLFLSLTVSASLSPCSLSLSLFSASLCDCIPPLPPPCLLS